MEEKCRYSYNEIDDSLIIFCKKDNEEIKENYMIDDIIFSLTDNGKIAGLQIRNASEVLEESGISPEILDDLKEVYLNVKQKEQSIFIGINLISENAVEKKFALGRIFMPKFQIC